MEWEPSGKRREAESKAGNLGQRCLRRLVFHIFRPEDFSHLSRETEVYASVDLAGASMRSGQSQIRPTDSFLFKLLCVFFCFGDLCLLACF